VDDVNRFDFLAKVKINKLDCMFLCLFFEGQGGILKCTDVPRVSGHSAHVTSLD
jgi:hypothetical protein